MLTKKNKIISGHRRFQIMTNLGWKECDVRIIEPENEIISLIEHNRHRQKTTSDILNEFQISLRGKLRSMLVLVVMHERELERRKGND